MIYGGGGEVPLLGNGKLEQGKERKGTSMYWALYWRVQVIQHLDISLQCKKGQGEAENRSGDKGKNTDRDLEIRVYTFNQSSPLIPCTVPHPVTTAFHILCGNRVFNKRKRKGACHICLPKFYSFSLSFLLFPSFLLPSLSLHPSLFSFTFYWMI